MIPVGYRIPFTSRAYTRELAFKGHGRAVSHRARTHTGNSASHHQPTDRRRTVLPLHVQLDERAREHAVTGLDERSPRRHIDDGRFVAGTDAREQDAVFLWKTTPRCAPAIDGFWRYRGIHVFDRLLNLRMRVRPVSPNTRMTYCESSRPRM